MKNEHTRGGGTTQNPPTVSAEFLELLKKLKAQAEPTIGVRLRLDKLTSDSSYRQSVLNLAINSSDEKSRDLALDILQLHQDLQALHDANLETPDPAPQATASTTKRRADLHLVSDAPEHEQTTNTVADDVPLLCESLVDDKKEFLDALKTPPIHEPEPHQADNEPPARKTKMRWIVISLLVVAALALTALGFSVYPNVKVAAFDKQETTAIATTQPATQLFRMHGSNTIGEALAPSLLDHFMVSEGATGTQIITNEESPLDRQILVHNSDGSQGVVELAAHGSSTGFKALLEEKADIAMASRKIKDSEVLQLVSRYGDLSSSASENIIGLDGLAIIVNPENPINSLSTKQIAQLFSGEITDWSALGGYSGKVHVYARESNSGTWDTFKSLVLKPNKTKLVETAHRYESSSELSDHVATDTGGIGFIALPYVRHSKLLAVSEGEGTLPIVPTPFTIGTEDYPLSRRLYLYMPQTANNEIKSFVEFVHSKAGQDVVEEHGFVSQNVFATTPYQDPSYPWKYRELTKDAQRLSLNFRFNSASNELDNKANRDLNRVVDYIFQNKVRRVLLFGFTDSTGYTGQNLALSQERVEAIAKALNARGVYPSVVEGMGEAIPIAANNTPYGRYKNRRVEIWVE